MKSTAASLAILLNCAYLNAQGPTADPLLGWMDKIAQKELDARETTIAGIRTVADAEARK
jgi:hypothetical protein